MKKINIDLMNRVNDFVKKHPRATLLMMVFLIGLLVGFIMGSSLIWQN